MDRTQKSNSSNPASLWHRLLFSGLGGLLMYGILWSAHQQNHLLFMMQSGLVPILVIISMTSKKSLYSRRAGTNPLIAMVFSYFLSLAEILMIREIEAPALASNYHPIIKKRQPILATSQAMSQLLRN
jgi:hypothetical protein